MSFTVWLDKIQDGDAVVRALGSALRERGTPVEEITSDRLRSLGASPEPHPTLPGWVSALAILLNKHAVTCVISVQPGPEEEPSEQGIFVAVRHKSSTALRIIPDEIRVPDACTPSEATAQILAWLETRKLIEPAASEVYSAEEEEKLRQMLDDLGYL